MKEIDNEVMEALEQERYAKFVFKGKVYRIENIIDLINCKNAVIEDFRHEIRKLECEKGQLEGTLEYLVEQAKIEGAKDFAKRLKDHYIKDKRYDRLNAHTLICFLFGKIDSLIKEMEGGTK